MRDDRPCRLLVGQACFDSIRCDRKPSRPRYILFAQHDFPRGRLGGLRGDWGWVRCQIRYPCLAHHFRSAPASRGQPVVGIHAQLSLREHR
jgi:hypothetical protein